MTAAVDPHAPEPRVPTEPGSDTARVAASQAAIEEPADDDATVAEIATNILEYANRILLTAPAQAFGASLVCRRIERPEFNAGVTAHDETSYAIGIFDGTITALRHAFGAIDPENAPSTHETFESLARDLLGDGSQYETLLRHAVYLALCFVLFHEFGHIRSGHFRMQRALTDGTAGPAELAFDEAAAHAFFLNRTDLVAPALRPHLSRMAEMEADSVAIQLLCELAPELFEANSEIAELLDAGLEPPGDTGLRRERVGELSLYAAGAALSLIEASRVQPLADPSYPFPYARLLQLFIQYIHLELPGWSGEGGVMRFGGDDRTSERMIRSLVNLIDLGVTCCEGIGRGLADTYGIGVEDGILLDFLRLIRVRPAPAGGQWTTREVAELAHLQALFPAFRAMMRPFRIDPWDVPE